MRGLVECKNCGIKWVRVTANDCTGGVEYTDDLMYNCPTCGSNYYGPVEKE